jgi:hypothetical protein
MPQDQIAATPRTHPRRIHPSILIFCFIGLAIEIALMSFKFSDRMQTAYDKIDYLKVALF